MDAKQAQKEHREFLQNNAPNVLSSLRQSGDLNKYLSSVGESASQMYDHIMAQYMVSPEVQKLPFHDRVSALQSRRREAEELVRHDVINQPLPEE